MTRPSADEPEISPVHVAARESRGDDFTDS